MIRPEDEQYLTSLNLEFAVEEDALGTHVIIRNYVLPEGLAPRMADLLVTLPPGFPDAAPDMFWLTPNVTKASGAAVAGTEAVHTRGDRSWQRWSRHIGSQWRAGIDDLRSYVRYINRCLVQEVEAAA